MSHRQLLKTCRILVAILLLNMVTPLVVQAEDSTAYVLLCTSSGLSKLKLSDIPDSDSFALTSTIINETELTASESINTVDATLEHCVYCNLTDKPIYHSSANSKTPLKNLEFNVYYQLDTKRFISKSVLQYVQLRAPPTYI